MPRYERLKEPGFEESDLFEVGQVAMNFIKNIVEGDGEAAGEAVLVHSSKADCAELQKSIGDHNYDRIYTVPSTEILSPGKVKVSKGFTENYHGQVQQQQSIENVNPNVCSPDPPTKATVAICSRSSIASTASLVEQQGGIQGGTSLSGRRDRSTIEDRSSRWRAAGSESYRSDNPSSIVDSDNNGNINSSDSYNRWTPSIQRVTSRREPTVDHPHQESFSCQGGTQAHYPQHQENQVCALHSSCNDPRYCPRFSKESSPVEGMYSLPPGPETTSLSSGMHPRSDAAYGGSFSQERSATFQRSNFGRDPSRQQRSGLTRESPSDPPGLQRSGLTRESPSDPPGLQRSSSTRDRAGQRSEMSIENWRDHPASRSAHGSDRSKPRVSFSLTENHELETQKQREKSWRESTVHCKKALGSKYHSNQQQQQLRYNYEQPGFVEREKENACGGKAYTIYGVKELKECPKGSSGRHQHLVRGFSLRESASNYAKMPRAYSVNSGGRHCMPMECDTCGKGGIGIFFLGLPGDEANFCKSCRTSGSQYNCPDKPPKKKKSIMHYCRKLLRFPQK